MTKTPSSKPSYKMPNRWAPREYQLDFWRKFIHEKSVNRAILCWHRRAGKDSTVLNAFAVKAASEPGLYLYMAPSQKHAREIIWTNVMDNYDPETGETFQSKPMDQAFPNWLVERKLDQEMTIHLKNGSVIRVLGSENYNSIVGVNARGVVYSEWGLPEVSPESWEYIEPMLQANGGWALFASTPRGMNHYWKLINGVRDDPDWYYSHLTVEDTGIVSKEQIEKEAKRGKAESSIRQEYYCDFLADVDSALFSTEHLETCRQNPTPIDDPNAPLIMGVDVARMGDDRSVIAYRVGADMRSIPMKTFTKLDNVQLAEKVIQEHARLKPDAIIIDATGTGSGVYDIVYHRLSRTGTRVFGVNFAKKAPDTSCLNMRAYMYEEFRKWTEIQDSTLPDDHRLHEELRVISKDYDMNGKLKLQDKEKFRKELGFSPDLADACALTFAHKIPGRMFMSEQGLPQRAIM